jgi:hypothetical protein
LIYLPKKRMILRVRVTSIILIADFFSSRLYKFDKNILKVSFYEKFEVNLVRVELMSLISKKERRRRRHSNKSDSVGYLLLTIHCIPLLIIHCIPLLTTIHCLSQYKKQNTWTIISTFKKSIQLKSPNYHKTFWIDENYSTTKIVKNFEKIDFSGISRKQKI